MVDASAKGEIPYDEIEGILDKGGITIGGETIIVFTNKEPHKALLEWLQEHNPLSIISIDLGKVSVGAKVEFDHKDLFVFVVELQKEVVQK
jgi:hypothetical protein